MDEHELERMVVRLQGDSTSYMGMLHGAVASTVDSTAQIQALTARIESYGDSLESFAHNAVSALSALGVVGYLRTAFQAFEEREAGIIRLNAALRGNQRDVEATTAEYRAFAREMEAVSTSSVGATLGLLRQAETFRTTGAGAERAVKDAIALGAATGQSAEHVMRLTAAMARGDTQEAMRMGRVVQQLRYIRDINQFTEEYNKLLAAGTIASQEQSETAGHAVERLHKAVKALWGDLGEVVAKAVKPYVDSLREAVNWLRGMSEGTKTAVVATMGLVAAVLLVKPALMALSFIGSIVMNPLVLALAVAGAAIAAWVEEVGGVQEAWDLAKASVLDFLEAHGELLIALGAGAIAVGAVVLAVKAVAFALGVLNALYFGLGLNVAVNAAAWAAWQLVVMAANGVVALFNFNLAAVNLLVGLAPALLALFGGGATFASVGTFLLDTAVALLESLLGGLVVVLAVAAAAAATFAIVMLGLAAAVSLLTVPAMGVAATLVMLWQTMMDMGSLTAGPIGAIGDMLGTWGPALLMAAQVAMTDLPLAWEIVKAAGLVAVNQLKDMWPPLWEFIRKGFTAIATYIRAVFDPATWHVQGGVRTALAEVQKELAAASLAFTVLPSMETKLALEEMWALMRQGQAALDRAEHERRRSEGGEGDPNKPKDFEGKTELVLAGSAKALEILYGSESARNAMAAAQIDATNRVVDEVAALRVDVNNTEVVRVGGS